MNIQAQGQLTKDSTIPVTGWQDNFDRVDIQLHLPPATMLLAVFGVDHASGSWLGKWTIWVSFLVLICTVMTWKVIGKSEAMITFVLLLLIFHDQAAPIVSIINFIIASAIHRFQPFEKLQSISRNYWIFSSAIVFISLLYFSAIQLKSTIYPQITHSHNVKLQHVSSLTSHAIKQTQSEQYTKERRNAAALKARPMADNVERVQVTGSRIKQVDMLERYQADTQIQAGMGVPNWRWKQHTINWQSNVAEGQTFNLYILTGYSYLAVKLAGIIMALIWLAVLLRKESLLFIRTLKSQTQFKASEASSILAIVLSVSLLSLAPTTSEAQDLPEKWMLDELHTKLIQDPDCAPRCASINHLQVEAHKQQLTLTLEVHAAHDSAVAIPSSPFWFVQGVDLNGKSSNLLTRKEGKTYLPIKPGITDVKLIGTITAMESFQLRFIDKPLNVKVIKDDNWQIVGTLDNRLVSNTLEFTAVSPKQHQSQQSRFAIKPLVKIHRRFMLDNEWTVFTSIERVAPTSGSINLSVPLIVTERVLSEGINVEHHQTKVNIPAGTNRIFWRSKIDRSHEIKLNAKANSGFVEHWSFIITPTYHAAFTGLPNVIEQQDNSDYYQYHFYPLPDEILTVSIERPQAIKGGTLAIDSVKQILDQGLRSSTLTLDFAYRSTQGGEHTIALPQDFELKQVKHDNTLINIQTEQGKLTLPISPKEHRYRITLRSSASIDPWLTSPAVNLNAPVSNIETRLNVGSSRWILWADGPTLGPAVLYWGELLAFILVALVLTRIPFSPLSTLAWIILGLGLSLNNWGFLILLFVWFAALSASQYRPQTLSRSWFNLTQLLLFGLSAIVIPMIPEDARFQRECTTC
ncbi:hypothetical protein JQC92_04395 [Shewanella sp. 202IG2-18]|uniref:hypothetical protein n=1 Tax=Parashewanella hymeniacidonis TaxID=2807618 RepID=UPI00195F7074|nr:hypothetical protein [Parashewanella hymeniacidonis]MBM7071281.1 hypothetical protein [Parashewanella hymeniacidonis]